MSLCLVGVGEWDTSLQPGAVIKTMALGSCVAVALVAPASGVVGLLHVALPDSSIAPAKAAQRPGYFADTGIPGILRAMARRGADIYHRSLVVKLAGGAKVMDPHGTFNIGQRNIQAIRQVLGQHGLSPVAEDLGGVVSRNVEVHVDGGRVFVASAGRGRREM
ncbi:MAG: chemotaxis protein CheD [Deltaproteobacteria bacterium]|nr:chemotaxis protein CheD [Deltaproteobacteria bacterium]